MTFKSPVVTLTGFGSLLTLHLGHFASLLRYLQVSFLSLGNLSYFLSAHLSQHIFNCPYLLVGLPQWVSSKESPARQETWFQSLGEHPLEKEMATYSSILAWKTPWTEEPGGLQSIGSHRVEHNWACTHLHALIMSEIVPPKDVLSS